jgi:uncharacterized membrane protein YjfL (UPF0719 family)
MEYVRILAGPLSLAGGVLLFLIVVTALLWLTGKISGYDPVNEILERNNPALGVRYSCFAIAIVFALLGIFDRAQGDAGLVDFAEHAIVAILLIYLSGFLNDWLILYHFNNDHEVIAEKNVAVAVVEGSTYLASSYVVGGAFYDWEAGIFLALIWFLIGQALLVVLALLYRGFAADADAQLDDHNLAVGFSLGSFLLSGGIVCGAVISGPSKGWQQDLVTVAAYLLGWIALMTLAHLVSEALIFRKSRLGDEVSKERNLAAALFKAVIFLSVTLGFTHG